MPADAATEIGDDVVRLVPRRVRIVHELAFARPHFRTGIEKGPPRYHDARPRPRPADNHDLLALGIDVARGPRRLRRGRRNRDRAGCNDHGANASRIAFELHATLSLPPGVTLAILALRQ